MINRKTILFCILFLSAGVLVNCPMPPVGKPLPAWLLLLSGSSFSNVPNVTLESLDSAYVSVNSGAVNNTGFTWKSNRTGTYTIRRGASSCADGTVIEGPAAVTADATNTGPTINASVLSIGANSVRVCVVDGSNGLTGFTAFTITRDDTNPTASATLTGIGGGNCYSPEPCAITLACDDSGGAGCDKIAYITEGIPDPEFDANGLITNGTLYVNPLEVTYQPDQDGAAIRLRSRDRAGNVSTVVSQFFSPYHWP